VIELKYGEIEPMIARVHKSGAEIVADKGEQIYREQFQATYEKEYGGQYVAIDILTKRAYVAASPEDALHLATAEAPDGLFHLMRIEAPSSIHVLC
jgi:hypothetical protein